jgi:hypothetical protein
MQAEVQIVSPEACLEHVFTENTGVEGVFYSNFFTDATFSENLENFWRKTS